MRSEMLVPAVLLILATTPGMLGSQSHGAPEFFTANLHATGATGGAAACS